MKMVKSRAWTALVLAAIVVAFGAPESALAGSPAARKGDPTSHGGTITTGSPNVRIQGVGAATVGTYATCPILFHVGGNIATGSPTVFINGAPAARVGSVVLETGAKSTVSLGAVTVQVE